jgi:large subunit ribosomal protein L15
MDLKTVTSKGTKYQTRKRIGRGIGSGSGKTSGRGHKGQGSRSGASRKPGFEGGQMPLYRRVPKRGFTNARFRTEYTIVNVRDLEVFDAGAVVDLDAILAKGLTSLETKLLKVLGMGELTKKLTVKAQKFSKSAADKIVAAGGEVIELGERGKATTEEEAPKKAASAEAPAEEPAAEEAPAEEPAAEEAPAEEPAAEEAPVEETPEAETEEEAGETDA